LSQIACKVSPRLRIVKESDESRIPRELLARLLDVCGRLIEARRQRERGEEATHHASRRAELQHAGGITPGREPLHWEAFAFLTA